MVTWLIGLSGAGKTTLAKDIVDILKAQKESVVLVDGDAVREAFSNDLGHTLADRKKNADRICRLCKFLDDQGIHVVCAILSLFPESRQWNRDNIHNYYEVFIEAPFEDLVSRDYKGLYQKAIAGELTDVAGVDIDFLPPVNPDLIIKNDGDLEKLRSHAPTVAQVIMEK